MPTLRLASQFLFSLIDQDVWMAKVPGSLMIDVFLRSNFTSDTNAQLVGFFNEFADAEEFVGKVFSNFEEKPQFLSNEEAEEMLHELWSAYKDGRLD